jgi:hypothetical protein
VTQITVDVVKKFLACLGKGKKELEVLKDNDDGLAWAAQHPSREITDWVDRAFAKSAILSEVAA